MITHEFLVNLTAQLRRQSMVITTAESCTGGLLSSYLTQLSGSSIWFDRGFITYSNAAKQELLAVPKEVIKKYGAVSGKVAKAMAEGALAHSQANIALAITGIAGPNGGTIKKPVGTVCFAWISAWFHHSTTHLFCLENRNLIREQACYQSLLGLKDLLN